MKGKPYSDTEIRPETPEVLRYLERQHYDSPEWHRDAGIPKKNRGLGNRDVETDADVYQISEIPSETKKGRI